VNIEYFLNEMDNKELDAITNAYDLRYKEDYEKIRWSAFVFACTQTNKLKEPKDLIKFSWEEEETKERTKEEIEKVKQDLIDTMKKRLNNNG